MMDVNYLLHRQQISLLRAAHAESPVVRALHETLARSYTARVQAYREANRASLH